MDRIFNAVKIFATAIILCGMIFVGGKASAEEAEEADQGQSFSNAEAMEIFRETVAQTSKFDDRVFHQDIYFVMPKMTANLEFLAGIDGNTLKSNGTFSLWIIDDEGNAIDSEHPFYLTQDNENMVVYFQDEKKKWQKMTSPTAAANFVDMVTTPGAQELDKMAEFIKYVTVLQDNDKQRTLLVNLDCDKIFEDLKAELEKDPDFQKQKQMQDNETVNALLGYIERGFKDSDIWYTWTVDKTNWQTTTMSFNLASLPQNIAYAALNDSSQPFLAIGPVREILENVAFYSEFKAYTTFLNPAAKAKLEIPKKVLKAKEVESEADKNSKKK